MPNWCSNNLKVMGNKESVLNFIKDNYKTTEVYKGDYRYILDFNKFLPTPVDEKGDVIPNWYDWRYENWGCKWVPDSEQCNDIEVEFIDGQEEVYSSHLKPTFNESNLNYLLENIEKIKSVKFYSEYDTPWNPAENIIYKWNEKYEDMILLNNFYEPGCEFAGLIGFDIDGNICVEYYDSVDRHKEYIAFTLQEEFESIDYYKIVIHELLAIIYEDERDEFISSIHEKICKQLEEEKNEIKQAELICEVFDKYKEKVGM